MNINSSTLSEAERSFSFLRASNQNVLEVHMTSYQDTIRKSLAQDKFCSVHNCNTPVLAKELCNKHYKRLKYNGKLERLNETIITPDKLIELKRQYPNSAFLPLTSNKIAIADCADCELLSKYEWCVDGSGYAVGYNDLKMHRYLMDAKNGEFVDHINHDKLDNRRCNLRICTKAENNQNRLMAVNNTSGYKGVVWSERDKTYYVKLNCKGKRIFIGTFKDKLEAAKAYDTKALELHGEFALTNEKLGLLTTTESY